MDKNNSSFSGMIVKLSKGLCIGALLISAAQTHAQVTLETQVKISDDGLHFNGKDLNFGNLDTASTDPDIYDYFFGRNISAHGDAVKTYKHYVFMTWYRGGKDDRHAMLSRYNTQTGVVSTIEFPHRHTGFRGDPNIGESHNTIGLALSPLDGTIHMVYDMHAYDDNNHDGKFKDDFFRYSYSVENAADAPDETFTLDLFVKDTSAISQGDDDYKHLTMTGNLADKDNFARLTYPQFFKTDDGTLLLYMRLGGNNNGAYVFNRYDHESNTWTRFTNFNHNNQKSKGNAYNWGLYGNMKYLNGKLRVGFQQRSSDNTDKYLYQNGVYYAYSDHPQGFGDWKNHRGEDMTWPLVDSDEIKVFEPGDYISHEEKDSVHIVSGFDWTVTEKGDIHIISELRSTDRNRPDFQEVNIHSYKPAGAEDFIISTDFAGATEIYTAGDNVYIIGLDGGVPYVERAVGGTNNFIRVYEASDDIQFDHGTVYITDGKVYYYLMERPTSGISTAMPLYLQIINLDIESEANAPVVSFPESSITVEEGYQQLSFRVEAISPVEGRDITQVDLYINDRFIRTDSAAPFIWGHMSKPTELLGLPAGRHTFRAVATDSEGAQGIATMGMVVNSNKPSVAFASEAMTVDLGYEKLTLGIEAQATVEGRTIESVTLFLNDQKVRTDDSVPYLFGHGSRPHETGAMGWLERHAPNPNPLGAGVHTFKAVALDSEGVENEATMTLTVRGLPEPPIVAFPKAVVTVTEGYEKLSITLPAESPVEGRTIDSVTLYRNGELVRVDTRSPWNFGHSFAPYEFGAMGWLERHEPNPNPLGVGTHTFRAVAKDNTGLEGEALMTLIVEALPAPTISFVESDVELIEGYDALSVSVNVETAAESIDVVSVALYINDSFVREALEAPYTWGGENNASELLALPAGMYVFKAVVTDSNNGISDASMRVDIAMLGDLDRDGDIDVVDVKSFALAMSRGEVSDMRYDFNNDGLLNRQDTRAMALLCTRTRCAQ
ncbi:BNR-4 repeat-containing protein [Glaciecola sp. SC05]|uniref:BNR-4 repeat-containing protein n=1 Tax=Glaciecola sp. SC05 TaxID=1987355 RepID=UPI003526FE09